MVMNFIVDYIDKSGNFNHASFQTLTQQPIDKHIVAMGACRQLMEQGSKPLLIVYVPGDHTPEEVESIAVSGPIDNLQPVFVAPEQLRRKRE